MVQYIERYKKDIAVDMRKRGFSYSEIQKSTSVPKSTLAYWLKGLELTDEQAEKLKEKRIQAMRAGAQKKILRTAELIEEMKNSSAKDIDKISKRELWFMGIVLYWRERFLNGNESDLRKGVRFTSSDPYLVKLFLKWLREVGSIGDEEIGFDIFIGEDKKDFLDKAIDHWSSVTGFPKNNFSHIYFQKNNAKNNYSQKNDARNKKEETKSKRKTGRRNSKRTFFGLLRIRVKASSMLARQIAGWIRGIRQYYWTEPEEDL